MQILEQLHPVQAAGALANRLLAKELEVLGPRERAQRASAQESMNKNQQDYFLREQLKVIRAELGEEDEDNETADEYRQKIRRPWSFRRGHGRRSC